MYDICICLHISMYIYIYMHGLRLKVMLEKGPCKSARAAALLPSPSWSFWIFALAVHTVPLHVLHNDTQHSAKLVAGHKADVSHSNRP